MDKAVFLEKILGRSTKANRDYLQFRCPFCNHRKPKLGVSLTNGKWKCWVCPSKGGTVYTLLRKLNVKPQYLELSKTLFPFENPKPARVQSTQRQKSTLALPKEFTPLYSNPSASLFYKLARNYLVESRCVTDLDMYKHRIGYCSSGPYADMVIFPSYAETGELNTFTARSYTNLHHNNFLAPKSIDKNEVVYDEMLINWSEPIILVESKLDSVTIRRNAVPLDGKQITPAMRRKIIENVSELVICLDGDALADAMRHARYFVQHGIKVRRVLLPEKEDPNSLGYRAIWKYINEAPEIDAPFIWKYNIKNKLKHSKVDN